MVNTSQQVGGSVGTSLLSTIFASAVASYTAGHLTPRLANARQFTATHGLLVSVGIFLSALLAMVILPGRAKARVPPSGLRSPRHAIGNCDYFEAADGARPGLALRRRCGAIAPAAWCVPQCVGDATEESAADGALPRLAADNQSGVNLLAILIDRLGHRFVACAIRADGVCSLAGGHPRRPLRRFSRSSGPARRSRLRSVTATTNEPARPTAPPPASTNQYHGIAA